MRCKKRFSNLSIERDVKLVASLLTVHPSIARNCNFMIQIESQFISELSFGWQMFLFQYKYWRIFSIEFQVFTLRCTTTKVKINVKLSKSMVILWLNFHRLDNIRALFSPLSIDVDSFWTANKVAAFYFYLFIFCCCCCFYQCCGFECLYVLQYVHTFVPISFSFQIE